MWNKEDEKEAIAGVDEAKLTEQEVEELKKFPLKKSEPEEEKVENPPEKEEDDGRLKLTAKQFIIAVGIHERKAGGFLYWAKKEFGINHKLKTTEWQPLHEKYLKRKV